MNDISANKQGKSSVGLKDETHIIKLLENTVTLLTFNMM